MKRFIAVQHSYSEFLGIIEKQLENRGIGFTYYRPFTGQSLPASALQFDALWMLGGAHAPWDEARVGWRQEEERLIHAFMRARRPVVGIGFGAQLLALTLGGRPGEETTSHAGWTKVQITAAGLEDPLAQAIAGRWVLVAGNGRCSLPEDIEPLAVDESGRWLLFRRDLAVGMLCRPELTPGMIEDMIMEEDRELPDDISDTLMRARELSESHRETTDCLLAALVSTLDLMRERRKPPVFTIQALRE
jgi:GMP synthase (glutamine-hydrolysing)